MNRFLPHMIMGLTVALSPALWGQKAACNTQLTFVCLNKEECCCQAGMDSEICECRVSRDEKAPNVLTYQETYSPAEKMPSSRLMLKSLFYSNLDNDYPEVMVFPIQQLTAILARDCRFNC